MCWIKCNSFLVLLSFFPKGFVVRLFRNRVERKKTLANDWARFMYWMNYSDIDFSVIWAFYFPFLFFSCFSRLMFDIYGLIFKVISLFSKVRCVLFVDTIVRNLRELSGTCDVQNSMSMSWIHDYLLCFVKFDMGCLLVWSSRIGEKVTLGDRKLLWLEFLK